MFALPCLKLPIVFLWVQSVLWAFTPGMCAYKGAMTAQSLKMGVDWRGVSLTGQKYSREQGVTVTSPPDGLLVEGKGQGWLLLLVHGLFNIMVMAKGNCQNGSWMKWKFFIEQCIYCIQSTLICLVKLLPRGTWRALTPFHHILSSSSPNIYFDKIPQIFL